MRELRYRVPTSELHLGATYTNETLLVRLLGDGTLAGLWCAQDDQIYCGKWRVDFIVNGRRVQPDFTEFEPAFQRTSYQLPEAVEITKTVFLPERGERSNILFMIIHARNHGSRTARIQMVWNLRFPEVAWVQHTKFPERTQQFKRVHVEECEDTIVITREDQPDEVRVMNTGGLDTAVCTSDDRSARVFFEEFALRPGRERVIPLAMAISPYGEADARATLEQIKEHQRILEATRESMRRALEIAKVVTPDPMINRAVQWAKVTTFRQKTKYPSGYGFTNDPPQDTLVVRDAAWFVLGADYYIPEFSCGMLELIQRHGVEPGGKLTEYLLCALDPPIKNDYGMNINDNTPLFIIAAHHHCATSQNREFLKRIYPTVRDAARWILFQRKDGLVFSTSEEANVWGICGWRNIIPGYSVNGAVTEINSECYRAFICAAELAEAMEDAPTAERFRKAAEELKDEINNKLKSEKTGYYLLNRDTDGIEHHDLTGDMVFPVMFGVAGKDTSRRVLDVLYTPMFWTPFGVRTVAQGEWNYDPEFGVRLTGGVWGNLTAWVAFANRHFYADRMVEAMRNIYAICEVSSPRQYRNVVPGEFPECLHGENYQSRGMSSSPWLPPTYLWLAVEGILGVTPSMNRISIEPNLPRGWKWAIAQRLRRGTEMFSFFYHAGKLFSTIQAKSRFPLELFEHDVSDQITVRYPHEAPYAAVIALRREGKTVVFVGADERTTLSISIPSDIGCGQAREVTLSLEAGEGRLLQYER